MISLTAWGTPCLVLLSCCPRSAVWCRAIGSSCTVAVTGGWSVALVLHRSRTVAACPHVLQALAVVPACMSCRPIMVLMLGVLETCVHAFGICEPCHTGRPARLFFVLEAHGLQGATGRVGARSPPRREAGSGATGHVVHMVALEPFSPGRRVLEPLDTRRPRSPPRLGGRIRSYRICGGARLNT
jgi:hypothetical protein